MKKLSGQLLKDVTNRIPGVLKRRYFEYLKKSAFDLNRPGFESLRKFVVEELIMMTSGCIQTFFNWMTKKSSCSIFCG